MGNLGHRASRTTMKPATMCYICRSIATA